MAGLFFTDYPPSWEKIPPGLRENWGGSVGSAFDPDQCVVGSSPTCGTEHFGFPPVLRDWVIKGLGMSSVVYATGHIKDPVPLIAKRSLPVVGFLLVSFIK